MLICVVPAAGLGSRLGAKVPKLFVDITPGRKVIDILESNICDFVDECCFVIRPNMVESFSKYSTNSKSTYVIQQEPLGMGDAIFKASRKFSKFDETLVIWGDQVSLNRETLERVIRSHRDSKSFCTIPLVKKIDPYVHYEIDTSNKFINLLQSREGDLLPSIGNSDIGIFLLNSESIVSEWDRFLGQDISLGNITNEINFLPFLFFLAKSGKKMNFIHVADSFESLGMNTPDELERLRHVLVERER
jgi:bifunctional N-acetylglucosamine-1-phosphate-uridyltransferase/glucosamine-1-phosphate-acetyltransferase GlmU-like protein